jgi:hypothetical protein
VFKISIKFSGNFYYPLWLSHDRRWALSFTYSSEMVMKAIIKRHPWGNILDYKTMAFHSVSIIDSLR